MLYGAYGTTGRLILDEAQRRGHRPLLAGRSAAPLSALGDATGLPALHLPLEKNAELRAALARVRCVLHAAGPYQLTGNPMRAACIDSGCSYLDINGEIDDYGAALACDGPARAANIAVIPGVGYGVVFAECLSAQLSARIPDATWLRLSFATETGERSRGALLSTANAMVAGGREVYHGSLRKRPIAFSTWASPVPEVFATRFAAAPRPELLAVLRSTGIPNIVAGIPLPRAAAAVMRIGGPLLGRLLAMRAARATNATDLGPSAAAIAALRSRVWAEARNAAGTRVAAMLETGEGSRAAAVAAVRAVELQLQSPRVGALTPVQAFGSGFALLVPGTRIQEM
jgi:short subunit dehydrogenase-like uncharacterized protein